MRRAARTDGNQAAIVEALRAAGASVALIQRPVDALVGISGQSILMEFKDHASRYGRRGANKNQREFMETWKGGPVSVVDGPEAALRVLKVAQAGCFGVCCPHHGKCEKYAAIEGGAPDQERIGTCRTDGGEFPEFVEVTKK